MFSQTLMQAPRRIPVISPKSSWDGESLTVNPAWHQQMGCANESPGIAYGRFSTISPPPSRAAEYDVFSLHCKGQRRGYQGIILPHIAVLVRWGTAKSVLHCPTNSDSPP